MTSGLTVVLQTSTPWGGVKWLPTIWRAPALMVRTPGLSMGFFKELLGFSFFIKCYVLMTTTYPVHVEGLLSAKLCLVTLLNSG